MTEPRTAAGRALYREVRSVEWGDEMRRGILAIEAEARAAALAEARAAAHEARFPRQYTLDESAPAHETFLLGAQEIQTVILAAIDALGEGADK